MKPIVSIIMMVSNDTKDSVKKTFDSLGFEIQTKNKEYLEDEITYKKVIDNYLSIELLIANKDCPTLEKGIFDTYQPLSTYYVGSINKNSSIAYIDLLSRCTSEYICIIEPNILLDTGWLEQLHIFHSHINNSGIISIATNPNEHRLSVALNNDEQFTHVLIPNNNIVNNIYFFKKELLNTCPFPYTDSDNPMTLFCYDISKMGYANYYITTSFAIQNN